MKTSIQLLIMYYIFQYKYKNYKNKTKHHNKKCMLVFPCVDIAGYAPGLVWEG